MKQTTLRTILAAAVIAAAAPQARAGAGSNHEVSVSSNSASGDTHTARQSADNEQYIGCSMEYDGVSDKYQARCVARDRHQANLSCGSYKPAFVALIAGIGEYAYISFKCQGVNLVSLNVWKSSTNLPE
jgi:hypothetical protein